MTYKAVMYLKIQITFLIGGARHTAPRQLDDFGKYINCNFFNERICSSFVCFCVCKET